MRAFIRFPNKEGSWAKLMDILPRGIRPDRELVLKYYGKDASIGAFRAVDNTRMIFRRTGHKTYVVLPDIPQNKQFWRDHPF